MSSFIREATTQASDKETATSIALEFIAICLANMALALISEPFARALALVGQY